MDLTGDLLRGHSDIIVLSILAKKDSYGYEINKTVMTLTDGAFQFTEATLYTTFKRLEREGFITTYWKRGDTGKKRRYYSLTEEGKIHYEKKRASWEKAKKNLERILEKEPL